MHTQLPLRFPSADGVFQDRLLLLLYIVHVQEHFSPKVVVTLALFIYEVYIFGYYLIVCVDLPLFFHLLDPTLCSTLS